MKKSFSFILSIIFVLSVLTALPLTAFAKVTPITQNGVTYYVADNGRTSAVVHDNGITWLKEESEGTSAWYGIDNSQGLIEKGSLFWVNWVDPEYSYYYYFDSLDHKPSKTNISHKLFLYGVVNPNGTEDTQVANSVPMYIQLGADWDEDEIKNTFINDSDNPFEISFKQMECPDGTCEFAEVKSNIPVENGSLGGFPDLSDTASVSASSFSGGSIMLFAGGGFIIGAVVALLGMTAIKKRKNKESENA